MALANRVVVGVMRGRDFHHAGAKVLVNIVVCNDGNVAPAERQFHALTNQVFVALVLRVHHHSHVAQHGFGPCGGYCQRAGVIISHRVTDVPHKAVFFFALNFQVTNGRLQNRVPVNQAFSAVNQALLIELHKRRGHDLRHFWVHGEVLVLP